LLADNIAKLIDDKGLRVHMGRNSRKFAEDNFSIESVIAKTMDAYKKTLSE
jgi:glycosyltransferase involved in cell wall biosynthesis